ncbi:hypothetical protein [Asticcacaulis sp. W401b]|uniref:hypothetical protein n=1 Tax=Asticcacaulis sp. W401b TaxID=3388666 RepID=UPI003970E5D7
MSDIARNTDDLRTYNSPTGSEILGKMILLVGRAEIAGFTASGEPVMLDTAEVFWDCEKVATREGREIYLDRNGEEWTFDQLGPEEEMATNEA